MVAVENYLVYSKHSSVIKALTSSVIRDAKVVDINDENPKVSNMDHPSAKKMEKEVYEKAKEENVKEIDRIQETVVNFHLSNKVLVEIKAEAPSPIVEPNIVLERKNDKDPSIDVQNQEILDRNPNEEHQDVKKEIVLVQVGN